MGRAGWGSPVHIMVTRNQGERKFPHSGAFSNFFFCSVWAPSLWYGDIVMVYSPLLGLSLKIPSHLQRCASVSQEETLKLAQSSMKTGHYTLVPSDF